MKKLAALVLSVLVLLCCVSCGAPSADNDPDEAVRALAEAYGMTQGTFFSSGSAEAGTYLDNDLLISLYGGANGAPDLSYTDAYCVYIDETDPTSMSEIGLFRLADESYAETLEGYLQARIDRKIRLSQTYPDINTAVLKSAEVGTDGCFVYYICCENAGAVYKDMRRALRE